MATIFVERLVNLDFTFFDVQRGLVGETLLVDCTLSGPQNAEGMVLDFGHFKRLIAQTLEDNIDHKLILPLLATDEHGPCVHQTVCSMHKENTHIRLGNSLNAILLSLPATGFQGVEAEKITPECLETHLLKSVLNQSWWDPLWQLQIRLFPEPIPLNSPYFQYTHGLSKHTGACQRIAHGHRSRLRICVNGLLHADLTDFWCHQWQDIYLGSQSDETTESSPSRRHFAYHSPEGHYRLSLPAQDTYLLPAETTIENIAQHVADQSATLITQNRFTFEPSAGSDTCDSMTIEAYVYEGIHKGAIGTAIL